MNKNINKTLCYFLAPLSFSQIKFSFSFSWKLHCTKSPSFISSCIPKRPGFPVIYSAISWTFLSQCSYQFATTHFFCDYFTNVSSKFPTGWTLAILFYFNYHWTLVQCLTHGFHLISIYWIDELMDE